MVSTNEILKKGLNFHLAGDLQQAEKQYRIILNRIPNHADALHLSGMIAYQVSKYDTALSLIEKAIKFNPQIAIYHNNLGLVLDAIGDSKKAFIFYQKAKALDPNLAESYCNTGNSFFQEKRFDESISQYREAIRIKPDYAEAHYNLAVTLKNLNKFEEAIEYYRNAIKINKEYMEAYFDLGNILMAKGCFKEAADNYKKVIALNSTHWDAWNNLGTALKDLGNIAEAIEKYNRSIQIKPDYAASWYNLGIAHEKNGNLDSAAECYKQATKIEPHARAECNLGNIFRKEKRFSKALEKYKKALQIKHDYAEAYYNIGIVMTDQLQLTEAVNNYKNAIQINPEYAEARCNMAFLLFLQGDLKEGWKEYEWRFKRKDRKNVYPYTFEKPLWDGASFKGKTIFIHEEQGYGDTIQFIRYIPMVKERGGTVLFETEEPLVNLLVDFPGIDKIGTRKNKAKETFKYDFYVPLLSLPRIFETDINTIPNKVPYIHANKAKIQVWKNQIQETGFKIGIVWAGRPQHHNDANRSCSLNHFSRLSEINGVKLFGLQKGEAAKQVENQKGVVKLNLGDELNDFSDTAGAIANLDLIISVDTAVVHLAGAMGKPVWALLPYEVDWRWMLDREEDSPWYPTMQLFRQNKHGDWDGVFSRVAKELQRTI